MYEFQHVLCSCKDQMVVCNDERVDICSDNLSPVGISAVLNFTMQTDDECSRRYEVDSNGVLIHVS
jgi:hypothetical protein